MNYQQVVLGELFLIALVYEWRMGRLHKLKQAMSGELTLKQQGGS